MQTSKPPTKVADQIWNSETAALRSPVYRPCQLSRSSVLPSAKISLFLITHYLRPAIHAFMAAIAASLLYSSKFYHQVRMQGRALRYRRHSSALVKNDDRQYQTTHWNRWWWTIAGQGRNPEEHRSVDQTTWSNLSFTQQCLALWDDVVWCWTRTVQTVPTIGPTFTQQFLALWDDILWCWTRAVQSLHKRVMRFWEREWCSELWNQAIFASVVKCMHGLHRRWAVWWDSSNVTQHFSEQNDAELPSMFQLLGGLSSLYP